MKIALVDYIGYSDTDGIPIGHTWKVLQEYGAMTADAYEVEYIVPQNYAKKLQDKNVIELPCFADTTKRGKSSWQNVRTLLKSFMNIFVTFRKTAAEIVWFCNVDQFLFLYLGLFGFHHKKIVITSFATRYPKRYHNYFLNKVKKKADLFISSNKAYELGKNVLYMPDYLYADEIYLPHVSKNRDDKIICLGTMSRSKGVKEIAQICERINHPLEICGHFYDQNYYEEVLEIKADTIQIANEYLRYEDYLDKLGEVTYCFFNYDERAYQNITSGVLLECIFMGCVPIANRFLLENMKIEGIAYDQIQDIANLNLRDVDTASIVNSNRKIIKERYQKETIQKQLLYRLSLLGR